MSALPSRRTPRRAWWPAQGRWIAPAFAGAAATLAVLLGLGLLRSATEEPRVGFHFELHAPGADRVELLGTFNNWKSGDIVLNGPDASGHWTATAADDVEYIPTAPESYDAEPPAASPYPDSIWVPPCDYWYGAGYVRRPGYWLRPEPDWVYVPSHYIWTPRGYVFVAAYWDYRLEWRGVLFAPVSLDGPPQPL